MNIDSMSAAVAIDACYWLRSVDIKTETWVAAPNMCGRSFEVRRRMFGIYDLRWTDDLSEVKIRGSVCG